MGTNESGHVVGHEVASLYAISCFATLVLMSLTEQFADLPGAVAAFASGWYLLRL